MPWPWLLPVAAYLVGSISFAWIAGRLKGVDLRQHGSRNLGATNAGRVLGKRWFFLVFTGDVLKGVAAVLAARWVAEHATPPQAHLLPLACAAAAVLGHVFTCFHGFKGGKAVATSLGVLIGLLPRVAGLGFVFWLLVWVIGWAVFRLKKSDAVGPASVLAAIAAPIIHLLITGDPWSRAALPSTAFILLLAVLVIAKHRSNIRRMLAGAPAAPPTGPGPAAGG